MPDTAVTENDVEAAQREADTAAERLAEVERAALENAPADRPTAAQVAEQRHVAEFAARRVAVTSERAARSAGAVRLAGLEKLGSDIDLLAAGAKKPSSAMSAAVQQIAAAAAAFATAVSEHDARVAALHKRALDLGSEPPAPSGPRKTSAYVACGGDGSVIHKLVHVRAIGKAAQTALGLALDGDTTAATDALTCVRDLAGHRRAEQYFVSETGLVLTCDGVVPPHIRYGVDSGDLRPMTEQEIGDYLEGRAL